MQIAAQLYTLRDFCKTPEDTFETLKKVKNIGYNSVQVSGVCTMDANLLKGYADEVGVTICATHNPFDRIINETDALIAEHKIYDCKYIGLGGMPGQYYESLENCQQFLDQLLPAARKIADAGMQFVFHNHYWEFVRYNGTSIMEYLVNNSKVEELGLLVDTYWLQYSGLNPAKFIKDYAERINVVHYKDMQIIHEDNKPQIAAVGEGNMSWKEINEACLNANVKFAAVEQDTCPRDPFDCMKSSYNYCANVLGLK